MADPSCQGAKAARGTRPTPQNTKKSPPRTLPRVPWAQRDGPGRRTHVTRGTKFPGAPSDPQATLRRPSAKRHCAAPANHALNIALPSRPRPNRSTPCAARARRRAPPPWRYHPNLREALFSRAERPPPTRQRLSTLAPAAHNAPTRETAQQKGRADALPERARAKISPGAPTQASPKLFTSLCARKRAQNINSRAPATHRT